MSRLVLWLRLSRLLMRNRPWTSAQGVSRQLNDLGYHRNAHHPCDDGPCEVDSLDRGGEGNRTLGPRNLPSVVSCQTPQDSGSALNRPELEVGRRASPNPVTDLIARRAGCRVVQDRRL